MAAWNRFIRSNCTLIRSYSNFKRTKVKPFPKMRRLDHEEQEDKVAGRIKELVYNQYRAPLAMIVFGSEKHHVVATKGMTVGQVVYSGLQAPIAEGNCLPLKSIPIGSLVSSIESNPGDGGKYARGCGNCAAVLSQNKEEGKTTIRLPSGERKVLSSACRALVGVVARGEKRNQPIGKAGRAFHIYRYNKNWPRAHHKYRQRC